MKLNITLLVRLSANKWNPFFFFYTWFRFLVLCIKQEAYRVHIESGLNDQGNLDLLTLDLVSGKNRRWHDYSCPYQVKTIKKGLEWKKREGFRYNWSLLSGENEGELVRSEWYYVTSLGTYLSISYWSYAVNKHKYRKAGGHWPSPDYLGQLLQRCGFSSLDGISKGCGSMFHDWRWSAYYPNRFSLLPFCFCKSSHIICLLLHLEMIWKIIDSWGWIFEKWNYNVFFNKLLAETWKHGLSSFIRVNIYFCNCLCCYRGSWWFKNGGSNYPATFWEQI